MAFIPRISTNSRRGESVALTSRSSSRERTIIQEAKFPTELEVHLHGSSHVVICRLLSKLESCSFVFDDGSFLPYPPRSFSQILDGYERVPTRWNSIWQLRRITWQKRSGCFEGISYVYTPLDRPFPADPARNNGIKARDNADRKWGKPSVT